MSKIAEDKALKAYPIQPSPYYGGNEDVNLKYRFGFVKGYDQAIQDMVKDSDHLKYLSDNEGYAYACGCRKTMQDFLEKACEWLSKNARDYYSAYATSDKLIEDFKNYMQDEM